MKNLESILKILMPLIVTIFTIFIGNYCVIQPFQEKTWKEQNALERQNEKRKEAIRYFEELSDLMDKRLFLTRQFLWSIQSNNKEKKLKKVIEQWNIQLNKNIVKIAVYFASEDTYNFNECKEECSDEQREDCLNKKKVDSKWSVEDEWECNIHLNFRCIYNNTLKHYKGHSSNKKLKTLAKNQLDCLNQRIYQFNKNILELITSDKVSENNK